MASCSTQRGFGLDVRLSRALKGNRQPHRLRPTPPKAISRFFGGDKEPGQYETRNSIIEDLRDAIEGTQRGVTTTQKDNKEILAAVESLAELGKGTVNTGENLSGRWKLLWTTEKVHNWGVGIYAAFAQPVCDESSMTE